MAGKLKLKKPDVGFRREGGERGGRRRGGDEGATMRTEKPGRPRSRVSQSGTGGVERTGRRLSRSGTEEEPESGKQSPIARHASGEAWHHQVHGSTWGRGREDGWGITKEGLEGRGLHYKNKRHGEGEGINREE
ncbi:hypothetical protein NDU88_001622 [Pleurodeles waltl]|uniref:Uncharacterized protein n=1 Tax=Pleurodeles waltl TaxID=8319 RepID=A0AAV7P632_PLEWA|nr:hypothetical protein NDU88_001622 [Pleurodeles waltl]